MIKQNKLKLLIILVFTATLASQLITSGSWAQEKYITPGEAAHHIGEIQTVCGLVGRIEMEELQPVFIKLYQEKNTKNFTIVIYPSDKGKFTNPPLYSYLGKNICVKGMIKTYRAEPEIVLTDPSQITLESSK